MDKDALRTRVWDALEDGGEARFPFPPHGRIPNFAGADAAATVSGVDDHAEQVGPDAVDRLDLVVVGSVAVSPDGARVGKGEGYSDLEFAVLTELGLVDAETTVATTVHELQVHEDIPVDAHDVPLDVVVTPERVVRTKTAQERPDGIDWDALDDERIAEIPVLDAFVPDE